MVHILRSLAPRPGRLPEYLALSQLRDFRFWDQGLSSCIKASRQKMGVSLVLNLIKFCVLGLIIDRAMHPELWVGRTPG